MEQKLNCRNCELKNELCIDCINSINKIIEENKIIEDCKKYLDNLNNPIIDIIVGAKLEERHVRNYICENSKEITNIICIDEMINPEKIIKKCNLLNFYSHQIDEYGLKCDINENGFIDLLDYCIEKKINIRKIIVDFSVSKFFDTEKFNFKDGKTMEKIKEIVKENNTEFYCYPHTGSIHSSKGLIDYTKPYIKNVYNRIFVKKEDEKKFMFKLIKGVRINDEENINTLKHMNDHFKKYCEDNVNDNNIFIDVLNNINIKYPLTNPNYICPDIEYFLIKSGWKCPICNFYCKISDKECPNCNISYHIIEQKQVPKPQSDIKKEWACEKCTFLNKPNSKTCEMCRNNKIAFGGDVNNNLLYGCLLLYKISLYVLIIIIIILLLYLCIKCLFYKDNNYVKNDNFIKKYIH